MNDHNTTTTGPTWYASPLDILLEDEDRYLSLLDILETLERPTGREQEDILSSILFSDSRSPL